MEVSVCSQAYTSKTRSYLNQEFHQYQPPPNKIRFSVDNKYNVFLSFRGKDVRTTFVDHLYEALCGAGLRVFLDSEELEKGKEIESGLATAIETSDLFIPIFSKNYAESAWCLKEAAQMCRSNGFLIPLFYDVEPCDVRYPQRKGGPFIEAFQKHYGHLDRQDEKTIEDWKNALYKISSFSGWTRAEHFGYEGRLIERVVKDVLNTLKITPLDVPVHLVGLEMHICDLLKSLDLNSLHRTVRVGVCGIGGVGKTTLAKAVYNTIYTEFDDCFFAQKITSSLEELQRAILRRLVKYPGEVLSVDEGKALMKNRLRGRRILVILDNVIDQRHLEAVNGDWFGRGSRIIITSRDLHILHLANVDSVIHMTGLEDHNALELFSWHAFSRAFPKDPYKDLSTEIAKACKGHPLSLQVIGAHLFDKKEPSDIKCWEEALHNIGENQEISSVLRISYDGLWPVEREIFLDIACCFAGERKNDAIAYWEALYPNRVHTILKNLFQKMLIHYSGLEADLLEMHDLLRGMGRAIKEQADNNRRLWLPMGTHGAMSGDRAEGVNMLVYTGQNGRNSFSMQTMPCLRYLVLPNTKVLGNIGHLAPNLLWIKIRNCEFVSDRYAWLRLRNGFQVDSSWSQVRILSVEQCACLTRIPKTVDSLVNLRCLYLQDCAALTSLPISLGNLSQLEELYLRGCASLTSLPETLGNLKQLKCLELFECTGLTSLPSSTCNLAQLETLDLRGCSGLTHLPNTIVNLAQLRVLNLRGCLGLQILHDQLAKLRSLRKIYLSGRVQRESFRDGVAKLAQLREFNRGSLVQKKFHVYFVYDAEDEGEICMGDKYKCLRTGSLRICRDSEDNGSIDFREVADSSDIFVPVISERFVESNECMRMLAAINNSNGLVVGLRLRASAHPYRIKFVKTLEKFKHQSF